MQAGKLRHQVTLQSKGTPTRDSYGGEEITWVDVITIWAEVEPWQLRERLTLRRREGESVIGLRVRAPLAVSLSNRVVFEGTAYNVIDIDATLKHKGELLITARAEDTTP